MPVRNADKSDVQAPTWNVILTHDGSRTLQLAGGDVTFHSTSGAATESLHVFVQNSGIFRSPDAAKVIQILEIGFGTGLNFLLTVDEAYRRNQSIEYTALDQMLLSRKQFEELGFGGLVENRGVVISLAELFEVSIGCDDGSCIRSSEGIRQFQLDFAMPLGGRTTLKLLIQDFRQLDFAAGLFDTIYFDPFAPEVNPEFWQVEYFANMFALLRTGGTLVSYCVKSSAQRSLRTAGFEVRTVCGPPGGKREVLIATRPV